jgi:hypothetical protein
MPTYTFRNNETEEQFEETLKISELDDYKNAHPELKMIITKAPGIADNVRLGRVKPSEGFRDRLKDIKASHRGAEMNIM